MGEWKKNVTTCSLFYIFMINWLIFSSFLWWPLIMFLAEWLEREYKVLMIASFQIWGSGAMLQAPDHQR
jgi:hypothetical protein